MHLIRPLRVHFDRCGSNRPYGLDTEQIVNTGRAYGYLNTHKARYQLDTFGHCSVSDFVKNQGLWESGLY